MTAVFIVCAAAGGTILVVQFVMLLIGIGGHAFDIVDVPHDIGHGFGGDFHAGGDAHGGSAEHAPHGATEIFKILSFRTVTAALAFFGLAGLASQSAELPTGQTLVISVGAGLMAMVVVYWIMRLMCDLRAEGTVQIHRAVGEHGLAYIRIPGNNAGSGKIQINLQNRTMEYLAVTTGPELPTGAKVVVISVVNPTTLEVEADQ